MGQTVQKYDVPTLSELGLVQESRAAQDHFFTNFDRNVTRNTIALYAFANTVGMGFHFNLNRMNDGNTGGCRYYKSGVLRYPVLKPYMDLIEVMFGRVLQILMDDTINSIEQFHKDMPLDLRMKLGAYVADTLNFLLKAPKLREEFKKRTSYTEHFEFR